MIEGHLCTSATGTHRDGTWTGWVAKDLAIQFGDVANSMSRSAMQKKKQDWQGFRGFRWNSSPWIRKARKKWWSM